LEMGARHPGDIETLVNVALPTFTACLNVGSSHLSIFKTKDNIYATKLEILKNTKHLKAAIVLGDDSKLLSLAQEKKVTLYSFGTTNQNDAKVLQTETTAEKKMRISCKVFDTPLNIELPATHESYPINALAASFLAYLGKIKDKTICEGLNNFKPSSSRFKTHFYKNKIIVDDSYNASPESLISGIKTINKLYPQKKISYILGDMLELGDQSTKLHRDIGRLCMTGKKTHNLLTVGTESKEIKSSAISSGLNHKQTEHYSSVQKLIGANVPLSFFGDVIYIKGSNSIKLLEFLNYLINK